MKEHPLWVPLLALRTALKNMGIDETPSLVFKLPFAYMDARAHIDIVDRDTLEPMLVGFRFVYRPDPTNIRDQFVDQEIGG